MKIIKSHFKIKSDTFPILEGEEDEIINPHTYGKALALYLQKILTQCGYNVPFICCEDSGWWIEIKTNVKIFGLMCVRDDTEENIFYYNLVKPDSKAWIWKKFKFDDLSDIKSKIINDVHSIFSDDPKIEISDFH